MTIYDLQLKVTWALALEHDGLSCHYSGGALCFTKDGYLVTANHLFTSVKDWSTLEIVGRSYYDYGVRHIEFVSALPTLDIAVLKVEWEDGEPELDYMDLTNSIKIEIGVKLASHGHHCILFSSWFAKTSYPYKHSTDLATQLKDIDQTIAMLDKDLVISRRKNYPTPTFRTAANCFVEPPLVEPSDLEPEEEDTNDFLDYDTLNGYHPDLPLIELGRPSLGGYSGCPVFTTAGVNGYDNHGNVVGMLICEADRHTYVVPVDVLYYAIYTLMADKIKF